MIGQSVEEGARALMFAGTNPDMAGAVAPLLKPEMVHCFMIDLLNAMTEQCSHILDVGCVPAV